MANSYLIIDNDIRNIYNFSNINKNYIQYNNEYNFYDSWAFSDFNVSNYFEFPWLKGMSCAIRVSEKFLKLIIKH